MTKYSITDLELRGTRTFIRVDFNVPTKNGAIIREIAQSVLGIGDGEVVEAPTVEKKSLLGKLDFKSMLGKKEQVPA